MNRRSAIKLVPGLLASSPLPIERPSKFEFIVDAKAARQLKLTVPDAMRVRADRVIR